MESLIGLVSSFFGGWGAIAAAAVVVAAVGLLLWRVRAGGASAARAKRERIDAKAVQARDEVDEAVSGRSADENRRKLGTWAKD